MTVLAGDRELSFETGLPLGKLVGLTDELVSDWMAERGGNPDYIHGEAEARALVKKKTSGAAVLPRGWRKPGSLTTSHSWGHTPKRAFPSARPRTSAITSSAEPHIISKSLGCSPGLELVEEGLAFFDKGYTLPPRLAMLDTALRMVFSATYTPPPKNDLNLFRGCGRETLRGLDAG